MIIKRLKVQNWKVFDDREFNFTDGVNIIKGNNYSGKTSFIQALYFGLFNETIFKKNLTAKHLKKEGEKQALIEIDFIVNSRNYRLRRNISGAKQIKVDSHLYELQDGEEREEIESVSRKGEQLKKLDDLLKINRDYVKNINFILESSIFHFLDNPSSKIIEEINSILELDYFSKIEGYCDEASGDLKQEINKLKDKEKKINNFHEKNQDKFEELEKEINKLTEEKTELGEKIKKSKEKINKFSDVKRLIEQKEQAESKIKEQEEDKKNFLKELDENQAEIEEINKIEKDLKTLENKVSLYRKNKKHIISLQGKKDNFYKQKENLDKLEGSLREHEERLKNITKMKELKPLYQKYIENKEEIAEIRKEIDKMKKNITLMIDRESKLKNLEIDKKKMEDKIHSFKDIDEKIKSLKSKFQEYNNSSKKLEDLKKQISENKDILDKFKIGVCPFTKEKCPVAESLVGEYSQKLESSESEKIKIKEYCDELKEFAIQYLNYSQKKLTCEDLRKQFEELNKTYDDLTLEIKDLSVSKSSHEELKTKLKELEEINNNLQDKYYEFKKLSESWIKKDILKEEEAKINSRISKLRKEREGLELTIKDANLEDIDDKIKNLEKSIEKLEKDYSQYIRYQEKVRQKEKLNDKKNKLKDKIKQIDEKVSSNNDLLKTKIEEIENFKKTHGIEEELDFSKENQRITTWESQIRNTEKKIKDREIDLISLKNRVNDLLSPYQSKLELENFLANEVHRKYLIDFFSQALSSTLNELRNRKLNAIKEYCSKMWVQFKTGAGMHSIDWDEKFLPIIRMGNIERNMFQLSASEKLYIYFSIRIALLSELGPNYFIIADNLLNPFMKINQDLLFSLFRDIIDNTPIQQIIITGFDVPPKVPCDNLIEF